MSTHRTSETTDYEELRRLTFAIAYRMTGSVNDAEEIGQEAFLRLERARQNDEELESPKAWLSTVTTRLAIDHMRSARVRREQYVGPWLPEPLLTEDSPGPAEHAETADSLSQAFLVLLETLTPVERAVFLLREVFGYDYPQIAETVGKQEENCRQIAARARKHVEAKRARFDADDQRREELLERFLEASEDGDAAKLKTILAADAVVYSDGGGKASAARRPFTGADRIARFMVKITRSRLERGGFRRRPARVNGQPAQLLIASDDSISDVLMLDIADEAIQTIRIVRNPDKLRHLQDEESQGAAREAHQASEQALLYRSPRGGEGAKPGSGPDI